MRKIIFPYKMSSQSSRSLAQAIGATRVYPNRRYRPRPDDIIINWGNSQYPAWYNGQRIYNEPMRVEISSNKLLSLRELHRQGVATPDFTTDHNEACGWTLEGHEVYARTILRGSGGKGIVVCKYDVDIPLSPLYTKGEKLQAEYRVHVFGGNVIDYRKKCRKADEETTEEDLKIRNRENGWIYVKGVEHIDRVKDIAVKAVQALGLDFGGVDIGMREDGSVFVFEVNSACGMVNSTVESYANSIISLTNN
jgi:hypothetical protein